MTRDNLDVFKDYFPAQAVPYCFQLWHTYKFHFKIKRGRSTKLGDYTYHYIHQSHTITVNADLNPYSFMLTYLHEVAHMSVRLKYGKKRLSPHGAEWKEEFKILAKPMLQPEILPGNVLAAFMRYLANPKATSCSDMHLQHILHQYDIGSSRLIPLQEVHIGNTFILHNRKFVKHDIKRTRILCTEVGGGRQFLISKSAMVALDKVA
ncbi:MAG: transcription elongation protein SprT [Cytophagales bacterium]|nr:transcription elongation protein SprT [Cytophagales bacterium]